MKYIRMFLEWLFSFFYTAEELQNDIAFAPPIQSEDEWKKIPDPWKLYGGRGSSYLFRLRRFQFTNGLYTIDDFTGLKGG